MIDAAAFRTRVVAIKNGTRNNSVELKPGQLSHSIRFLAKAWRWSEKRVQRFLRALELDHSVTTETTTGQTTISLCNWSKYQQASRSADYSNDHANDHADDHKLENIKYIKEDIALAASAKVAGFEEWYSTFPRKRSRTAAEKAYRRVVVTERKIGHDDLLARTKTFAASWQQRPKAELQFCPYPASWLNAGGYFDEVEHGTGPTSAVPTPSKSASEFVDADWRVRLDFFSRHQQWPENEWGPRPGQPGCLAPRHLLIADADVRPALLAEQVR